MLKQRCSVDMVKVFQGSHMELKQTAVFELKPSPSPKYTLFSKGTHICLIKFLIIMFPVCPIWFQDPILEMLSSHPKTGLGSSNLWKMASCLENWIPVPMFQKYMYIEAWDPQWLLENEVLFGKLCKKCRFLHEFIVACWCHMAT